MFRGVYALVQNSQEAKACLQGGASILQLRIKNSIISNIYNIGLEIMKLKTQFDFTFILNDNPNLAKEVRADGVHLGQEDESVESARQKLGKNYIIGKSTHSLDQLQTAFEQPVDYVAFGPIFETSSKADAKPAVGLEMLKKAVELSQAKQIPLVAIGGISKKNIQSVLETRVKSVALISALTQAPDPIEATKFFAKFFQ